MQKRFWPSQFLETNIPVTLLANSRPSIIGVITTPETVAVEPITPCIKYGRYMIAENIIACEKNAIKNDTLIALSLKKR